MPPRNDPYATPRTKAFDLLLCLIIVALIVLMILTSPRMHHSQSQIEAAPGSAELAAK